MYTGGAKLNSCRDGAIDRVVKFAERTFLLEDKLDYPPFELFEGSQKLGGENFWGKTGWICKLMFSILQLRHEIRMNEENNILIMESQSSSKLSSPQADIAQHEVLINSRRKIEPRKHKTGKGGAHQSRLREHEASFFHKVNFKLRIDDWFLWHFMDRWRSRKILKIMGLSRVQYD